MLCVFSSKQPRAPTVLSYRSGLNVGVGEGVWGGFKVKHKVFKVDFSIFGYIYVRSHDYGVALQRSVSEGGLFNILSTVEKARFVHLVHPGPFPQNLGAAGGA